MQVSDIIRTESRNFCIHLLLTTGPVSSVIFNVVFFFLFVTEQGYFFHDTSICVVLSKICARLIKLRLKA